MRSNPFWLVASILAVASAFVLAQDPTNPTSAYPDSLPSPGPFPPIDPSISLLPLPLQSLLAHLQNGTLTSVQLVDYYLDAIAKNNEHGLELRAVIQTAPREGVRKLAWEMDDERRRGKVRGPLHGVPIIVKDNIATNVSLGMNTTAGSFALQTAKVPRDAHVVRKLREAGAIILAKANLSELAYMKGFANIGWSAVGGQTQSAYVVGGVPAGGNPGGSSSGSAVAVSAGWAAAALGTETDGSIINPSSKAALYAMKPTVGLVSRAGIVPVSLTQDSAGPMAKSAWDVAQILTVIAGFDDRDPATADVEGHVSDFTSAVVGKDGFKGIRLGVPREVFFNTTLTGASPEIVVAMDEAIKKMASLGAYIQDPADLPSASEFTNLPTEDQVMNTDFKVDFARYASELQGPEVTTVAELINFNDLNSAVEMPPENCCQEFLVDAVQTTGQESPEYLAARQHNLEVGRTNGIDFVLKKHGLDALVLPSEGLASRPAAVAGYPIANVPLGYLKETGRPYGLAFIGTAFSERTLIRLMSAYEANFAPRQVPAQLV